MGASLTIDFDGTGDWLNVTTTPILTVEPLTFACWVNPDDITHTCTVMGIGDRSGGFNQFSLQIAGAVAGDPVRCTTQNFLTVANADTTSGYSSGSWQHICGVIASSTDRRAFLNGGNKGTNATSVVDPPGMDAFEIGAHPVGDTQPMFGLIAHAAVWNIALSDADVALLATGLNPLYVQPQAIVFYLPMWTTGDVVDWIGKVTLTVNGNPTNGASDPSVTPPMFMYGRDSSPAIPQVVRRLDETPNYLPLRAAPAQTPFISVEQPRPIVPYRDRYTDEFFNRLPAIGPTGGVPLFYKEQPRPYVVIRPRETDEFFNYLPILAAPQAVPFIVSDGRVPIPLERNRYTDEFFNNLPIIGPTGGTPFAYREQLPRVLQRYVSRVSESGQATMLLLAPPAAGTPFFSVETARPSRGSRVQLTRDEAQNLMLALRNPPAPQPPGDSIYRPVYRPRRR